MSRRLAFLASLLLVSVLSAPGSIASADLFITGRALPAPLAALEALPIDVERVDAHLAEEIGAFDFVRATEGSVLAPSGWGSAEERAFAFLRLHGGLLGLTQSDRAGLGDRLIVDDVQTGPGESVHVRLQQFHHGLRVDGGQVAVHLNESGVTAVNGRFMPVTGVGTAPTVSQADARDIAEVVVAKDGHAASASEVELAVYRTGMAQGVAGESRLAYAVEVEGNEPQQVWVDAKTGHVLDRFERTMHAMDRIVYDPSLYYDRPNENIVRREGEPPSASPAINNLYDFSGDAYEFFARFGHDSYDGNGATMRSVFRSDGTLAGQPCPEAWWDGEALGACPGTDVDDVVVHEWTHALIQFTAAYVNECEAGALSEGLSDIFGETVDLTNGVDKIPGNDEPYPRGVRWFFGEDFNGGSRNLWAPDETSGNPNDPSLVAQRRADRKGSVYFYCGDDDNGGAHVNSMVVSHAYAMLVDSKDFPDEDGTTVHHVQGIGLTKAAHIYWDALTNYESRFTDFAEHAYALESACADLAASGTPLTPIADSEAAGQTIVASDCAQVANANVATELKDPSPCPQRRVLQQDPEGVTDLCARAKTAFFEDFESGSDGWTLGTEGKSRWPDWEWGTTSDLPGERPGSTAFGWTPNHEHPRTCLKSSHSGPYNESDGHLWLESPEITLPEGPALLRFDHYVATERLYDGGNVLLKVKDADYVVIPTDAYLFNGPNIELESPYKLNQQGWSGTDRPKLSGSWGTTLADLSAMTDPGDTIQLQFDLGIDCGLGITGWYVDDVRIYTCPPNVLPEATLEVSPLVVSGNGPIEIRAAVSDGNGVDDIVSATVTVRDKHGRVIYKWNRDDFAVRDSETLAFDRTGLKLSGKSSWTVEVFGEDLEGQSVRSAQVIRGI